jgi:hypothetical protein
MSFRVYLMSEEFCASLLRTVRGAQEELELAGWMMFTKVKVICSYRQHLGFISIQSRPQAD